MSSMPRGMQAGHDNRAQPQKLQAHPHSQAAPWAAQTDKDACQLPHALACQTALAHVHEAPGQGRP